MQLRDQAQRETINTTSAGWGTNIKRSASLTQFQKAALTIIIMGIFVTDQLNWDAFERRCLKRAKAGKLSWLFYHAKISSELLLQASIRNIIRHYRLIQGGP